MIKNKLIVCMFFALLVFNFNACITHNNKKLIMASNTENLNIEYLTGNDYCLVIHGGAGGIQKKNLPDSLEEQYNAILQEALNLGMEMLKSGKNSVDVVEAVVKVMEDSPLFNAGKGSVFSNNGKNSMDASIMDGKDLSCGAVAGLSNIKNPVSAARLVKDSSKHVFLYGEECKDFCKENGMDTISDEYFKTEKRWNQYLKALKKDELNLDHDDSQGSTIELEESKKYGTVGCVALDKHGNVAAATSTGGLTNKKHGRIGDSPIIGAGTYANNSTCAVSCTGVGEYFIRSTVASDVSSQMLYGNANLKKASINSLSNVVEMGGRGGLIAIDHKGNLIMIFSTKGMYRGYASSSGNKESKIFR
jgi:beta-aspartyl-peptidase (threonine type)